MLSLFDLEQIPISVLQRKFYLRDLEEGKVDENYYRCYVSLILMLERNFLEQSPLEIPEMMDVFVKYLAMSTIELSESHLAEDHRLIYVYTLAINEFSGVGKAGFSSREFLRRETNWRYLR